MGADGSHSLGFPDEPGFRAHESGRVAGALPPGWRPVTSSAILMDVEAPPRRSPLGRLTGWARNISMATWLGVAVLFVTVASLVITSLLSLTYGKELADGITDISLESRAVLKADAVNRYLAAMETRTAAVASGGLLVEGAQRFGDAYAELTSLDRATLEDASGLVDDFYRAEFAPALEAAIGTTVSWRTLVPVGDPAIYLQRHYVLGSRDSAEQELIDDAGDGSTWSEVHRDLHLGFLEIAVRLEVADLYIIEPDSGIIVYSAAKKPDFATSLDTGPHSGSTLAAAMRTVREAPEAGVVSVLDMAPYVPDLGAPMMFMASPILDQGDLTAILVLKVPLEPIDAIMTSEQAWVDEGFGVSGETYLVGADGRMRSVARRFVEDPTSFLTQLGAAGTATQAERDAIDGVGTTAIFLKATDARDLAMVPSDGAAIEMTNYLQLQVLTAVQPIQTAGLDWFVLSEVERDELDEPVTDFRRAGLTAVAVFVILITFTMVVWARDVFRPVRAISEKLRRIRDGEPVKDIDTTYRSPKDFTDLAHNIDDMLAALDRRQEELEAASAERLDTLRSLLPAAIAERVQSGDLNVIDRVLQAGIVVLAIDGIGDLVRGKDVGRARELLDHLVEEIDSTALHHGLERVKLVGDTYFAGCGLTHPYLDHVPRSVAFALDARDVIREIGAEYQIRPTVSAGIHSGPITVGLVGSTRLVYDLWGETVDTAYYLARLAQEGEILVSAAVSELLPPDIATVARNTGSPHTEVWEIVGHRVPKEPRP